MFGKSNCVCSSARSIAKTDGLRLLHGILHAKPLVQPTRSPRGEFIGKPCVGRNSRNGAVPITGEDCSQICMKLRNRDSQCTVHQKNGKDYVDGESLILFFLVTRCCIFLKQALVVLNPLTFAPCEHTNDAERSI